MSRMTHFSPKEFDCGGGFLFRAYFSELIDVSRERENEGKKVSGENIKQNEISNSKFKGLSLQRPRRKGR